MAKLPNNQSGFSSIEVVFIFIIVSLISLVGWMVYKDQHKSTGKVNIITTSSNKTATPTADKTIFKIPELGIELINVPVGISDLTYVINKYGAGTVVDQNQIIKPATNAYLSTESLVKLDSDCLAGSLGVFSRVNGTYNTNSTFGFLKQFNGFWISFERTHADCGSGPVATALHSSQFNLINTLAENPVNIVAMQ